MNQFLYFVCVNGNKDLLKKEIELFYPSLVPSFSKGDFLTYKNLGKNYSLKEIENFQFAFALDWGINDGDLSQDAIEARLSVQKSKINLPEEAPSRAYLKIAEAYKRFSLQSDANINWIEFGSAPGGASFFLLNNFGALTGVDPGKMDDICLDNIMYEHLSVPIQNLSQEELPNRPVHYIASDLNLNPKQAIKEVIRLSKKYRMLKGIFMTIKMVKVEHVKLIPEFVKMFEDAGHENSIKVQLPSHRREFLIYAPKALRYIKSSFKDTP